MLACSAYDGRPLLGSQDPVDPSIGFGKRLITLKLHSKSIGTALAPNLLRSCFDMQCLKFRPCYHPIERSCLHLFVAGMLSGFPLEASLCPSCKGNAQHLKHSCQLSRMRHRSKSSTRNYIIQPFDIQLFGDIYSNMLPLCI